MTVLYTNIPVSMIKVFGCRNRQAPLDEERTLRIGIRRPILAIVVSKPRAVADQIYPPTGATSLRPGIRGPRDFTFFFLVTSSKTTGHGTVRDLKAIRA